MLPARPGAAGLPVAMVVPDHVLLSSRSLNCLNGLGKTVISLLLVDISHVRGTFDPPWNGDIISGKWGSGAIVEKSIYFIKFRETDRWNEERILSHFSLVPLHFYAKTQSLRHD